MNLIKILKKLNKGALKKIAFLQGDRKLTYQELWNSVDKISQGLLEHGIKEGDKIALCLPNSIEYVLNFLAVLKINAIAVPLKQTYTSYELKQIIKDCKPSLMITDGQFIKKILYSQGTLPDGEVIISSKRYLKDRFLNRIIKVKDLLETNSGEENSTYTRGDALASINYTYRGIGKPLGVMLTHGNYLWGIDTYIRQTEMFRTKNVLAALPFSHIYPLIGCLIAPLSLGSTVVIMDKLNPRELFSLIDRLKIHMLASVPSYYGLLLKNFKKGEFDLSSIIQCISGGSSLPYSLYQEIKKQIGWDICQGYGLTECLPFICNPIDENKPHSLGRLGGHVRVEVKIVDDEENVKEKNEIGEIIVKGKTVMKGYYNCPEETKNVFKNGWLYTGDLGYLDDDDYLFITGRKKMITKVGGNIVDVNEVKRVVLSFKDVIAAQINIMDDDIWGNVLSAKISVEKPEEFDKHQLKRFLRSRLSSYKIPQIEITQ